MAIDLKGQGGDVLRVLWRGLQSAYNSPYL
jgi:hypothetical protein